MLKKLREQGSMNMALRFTLLFAQTQHDELSDLIVIEVRYMHIVTMTTTNYIMRKRRISQNERAELGNLLSFKLSTELKS